MHRKHCPADAAVSAFCVDTLIVKVSSCWFPSINTGDRNQHGHSKNASWSKDSASYFSTYTSIHRALMFPKLFSSSMTASTSLSTFNTHVHTLNTLDKRLFLSVPVSVYMCGQRKRVNQKDGVFFDDGFKSLWLCRASTCVSKVLWETW